MADRFLIAPYDSNSGLQTNYKPWLIPDEAFSYMQNAYVFRGRVRKRFGSRWMGNSQLESRFRIAVGTLNAPVSPVPTLSGSIGQMFSIGDVVFTVNQLGTPINLLVANGSAATATFNTTTGVFVFAGVLDAAGAAVPGGTTIYFYPALPVMGLPNPDSKVINNKPTWGFDTKYAYEYTPTGWERLALEATAGAATWSGSNSQFFWTTTWTGTNPAESVFFVTNFNEAETHFMRYALVTSKIWTDYRPKISNFVAGTPPVLEIWLESARILVPFKNRLIAFNTWEREIVKAPNPPSNTLVHYQSRARWSWIGDATDQANAFLQDVPGKGNALDAPTTEAIISVEFVKDRLIVYFERSTYEFVYTGNQIYPFIWQKINTELGAESTFSIVPFDKVALGVGNVGIHACNGVNVERIDSRIPQAVFDIHNIDSGVERVYGVRDYYVEMVYWTFPSGDASSDKPYPNRVLVYNYLTNTWSFNDDSITVFGYYQPQTGVTWDSTTVTWDDPISWDSGPSQALFRQVIGGNQEGFTFIVDADETVNAPALQITDISVAANIVTITCIDNNFRQEEFVYLQDIEGSGVGNNLELLNNKIFKIVSVTKDQFTFVYPGPENITGTYKGGGIISRVSQIDVYTKEYNFYAKQGRNSYIPKVDFMVDSTDVGQVVVNFYVSTALNNLVVDGQASGSILGNSVLSTFPYPSVPFEATAERLWHPVYFQADGEIIQLEITMTDLQMTTVIPIEDDEGNFSYTGPTFEDFQLHAICIYAQPTSSRFQ